MKHDFASKLDALGLLTLAIAPLMAGIIVALHIA